MGKKSNKSLRESTSKKIYTDSDEIVRLRKELIEDKKSDGYRDGYTSNKRKSKVSFKPLKYTRRNENNDGR